MERSSTMWFPEKGEIAPKNFRQERMDSSRSSLKDRRRVTSSDSCREQFDDKKKCTTSSEIAAKDVKSTSERASSTVHFKQPMGEPCSVLIDRDKLSNYHHNKHLIKPKSEQSFNDLPLLTSLVHSDASVFLTNYYFLSFNFL